MITLSNISKTYPSSSSPVVRDISLTIDDNQTVVLLGSSGCGKTTTLKMINRLIDPTAGTIHVDNQNTADTPPLQLRRSIGYVFQDIGLFPHMTVARNVEIVPKLLGWPATKRRRRTRDLLQTVGLPPDTYAARMPAQLSGGQQQRVGIARALATDPKYLLMDEPFGALDAVTRDQLQAEFLRLCKDMHKTVVFVTHDLFEALRLGDRIAVMNKGTIEQLGTPHELLNTPKTDYVRTLFDQARNQAALLQEAAQ